jgi:2-C-methyl-D-erythritol 4-phosphate cytidylyltransferase/2-C-methyl-D-erythritol 2,4-cyclodiphosphate synthase
MQAFALIMAAGSGERMSGDVAKQFVVIAGRPMLSWSLRCFGAHQDVVGVAVVTAPGSEEQVKRTLSDEDMAVVDVWADGGERRQISVRKGMAALPAGVTHVLVHDAARPCVSSELITRVVAGLAEHDAIVPTIPVVDSLVRCSGNLVTRNVDRRELAAVQTPQAFEVGLIRRAHQRALETGFEANDDGALVLALGEKVATVPGDTDNIKVTFAADTEIAAAVIKDAH